jgi:hypothetical protein
MSRFDPGAGRLDEGDPVARPTAHSEARVGARHEPALLGATAPPIQTTRQPATQQASSDQTDHTGRPIPKGWPGKQAVALWDSMARPRPPRRIMIGGAEGGVGTSTVTALLGELIAAASPGPTVIADQCGMVWNSLARRMVGELAGMPAAQAGHMLELGATGPQVVGIAPRTSAGAALVDDGRGYTALQDITGLAHVPNGTLVIDGGRADHVFVARLDVQPVVIIVGRADVIGAEAVCAALALLQGKQQAVPIVVLSSVNTSSSAAARRRAQAATKLVAAAGITHLVYLPHDARLASGKSLRLDQVGKSTAIAGMQLLTRVGNLQGEIDAHRRSAPARPAAGPPPA